MQVLIITSKNIFSTYGGGQIYIVNLVKQFAGTGINICLASPQHNDDRADDYHGCNVYYFSPDAEQPEIEKLLREVNPDIVHINGYKDVFALACKDLGIPCLVTAHHGGIVCPAGTLLNHRDQICRIAADQKSCLPCELKNIRWGLFAWPVLRVLPLNLRMKIGRWLQKLPFILFLTPIGQATLAISNKKRQWDSIHSNAQLLIAPSRAIAESMAINGADTSKILVLPHGIPLGQPVSDQDPEKIAERTTHRALRFFFVGRICHVKGVHIMLEAFHRVKETAELHIIGGAGNKTEQRYLNTLKKRYKTDQRIIWHGKIPHDNVNGLMKDYDVMIHPAICLEVYGLNIAEALAMGKPVVATRCGGAEMQIEHGVNGWLVEPNNVQALEKTLQELISYEKVLLRIDTRKVAANSIESHCMDLINIYRRVVTQSVA